MKHFGLPSFRAHCVARFLWVHTRGQHGTSPHSLFVGDGAADALRRLAGGDTPQHLDAFLPQFLTALRAADPAGLLPVLCALGLFPESAQSVEHLLCDAGKVFGEGNRHGRKPARAEYADSFDSALPFFTKLSIA